MLKESLKQIVALQKELKQELNLFKEEYTPIAAIPTNVFLDGKLRKGILMLLPSNGCSWNLKSGGCFFCSYSTGYGPGTVTDDILLKMIRSISSVEGIEDAEVVYLYPFSTLDDRELSPALRKEFYRIVNDFPNIEYVAVESRPEFVTQKVLDELTGGLPEQKVLVYVGVETSNDFIRKYCINKGFTWKTFERTYTLIKDSGCYPCVFLLYKPPFLSEYDAYYDCLQSIRDCLTTGVSDIFLMVNNTAEYTVCKVLGDAGGYRPAWLWSLCELVKVLQPEEAAKVQISGIQEKNSAMIDFAGGDFFDYMHPPYNCGRCDVEVIHALKTFNCTKDLSCLKDLSCECYEDWEKDIQKPEKSLRERVLRGYETVLNYSLISDGT